MEEYEQIDVTSLGDAEPQYIVSGSSDTVAAFKAWQARATKPLYVGYSPTDGAVMGAPPTGASRWGLSSEEAVRNLAAAVSRGATTRPSPPWVDQDLIVHVGRCKPWRRPIRRDMKTGWRFKEAGCRYGHVWVWDRGTWRSKLSDTAIRALERELESMNIEQSTNTRAKKSTSGSHVGFPLGELLDWLTTLQANGVPDSAAIRIESGYSYQTTASAQWTEKR